MSRFLKVIVWQTDRQTGRQAEWTEIINQAASRMVENGSVSAHPVYMLFLCVSLYVVGLKLLIKLSIKKKPLAYRMEKYVREQLER